MKVAILLLAFSMTACAPTYRVITKKCPTTTMLLGDFVASGVALAASVLAYTDRDYVRMGEGLAAFGALGLGANLAETTCRR